MTTDPTRHAVELPVAIARLKLARVWAARGQLKRAVASLEALAADAPSFAPAHLDLAAAYTTLGRSDLAHAAFVRGAAACLDDWSLASHARRGQANASVAAATPSPLPAPHVVLYTDRDNIYGAEQVSLATLLGLRQAGYSTTAVQPRATNALVARQHAAGVRHVWLTVPDNLFRPDAHRYTRDALAQARAVFEQTKPDLVLFADGTPLSNLAGKEAAADMGIPFVAVVHLVASEWAADTPNVVARVRDAYAAAREVVAVSRSNLAMLRTAFGLSSDRGRVILNGRPRRFFEPRNARRREQLRRELRVPPTATLFFTAARMDASKGYQHQLAAIARSMANPLAANMYFAWAGSGQMESYLRVNLMEIGAHDRVRFLGDRDDINGLLDAADAFVLTSHWEGMPLALLEAMAKGVPVVATSVGGTAEALGDTGCLLPDPSEKPDDVVSRLADVLTGWTADLSERQTLGAAARARADELFHEDRMVADYVGMVGRFCPVPDSLRA